MKNELRQLSVLLLCVVSAPALACRLEFSYPSNYYEPERFWVWLNKVNDYVSEIPGSARSFACEDWYSGFLKGRVRVIAEYGDPGSDQYQMRASKALEYEIDAKLAGLVVIGQPFELKLIQPPARTADEYQTTTTIND